MDPTEDGVVERPRTFGSAAGGEELVGVLVRGGLVESDGAATIVRAAQPPRVCDERHAVGILLGIDVDPFLSVAADHNGFGTVRGRRGVALLEVGAGRPRGLRLRLAAG